MKIKELFRISIFMVISLAIISGCASRSKSTLKGAPKWFEKVPEKEGFIITTGTGKSADYQQAINKAQLEAKADLGEMVRSEIKENVEAIKVPVQRNLRSSEATSDAKASRSGLIV